MLYLVQNIDLHLYEVNLLLIHGSNGDHFYCQFFIGVLTPRLVHAAVGTLSYLAYELVDAHLLHLKI